MGSIHKIHNMLESSKCFIFRHHITCVEQKVLLKAWRKVSYVRRWCHTQKPREEHSLLANLRSKSYQARDTRCTGISLYQSKSWNIIVQAENKVLRKNDWRPDSHRHDNCERFQLSNGIFLILSHKGFDVFWFQLYLKPLLDFAVGTAEHTPYTAIQGWFKTGVSQNEPSMSGRWIGQWQLPVRKQALKMCPPWAPPCRRPIREVQTTSTLMIHCSAATAEVKQPQNRHNNM